MSKHKKFFTKWSEWIFFLSMSVIVIPFLLYSSYTTAFKSVDDMKGYKKDFYKRFTPSQPVKFNMDESFLTYRLIEIDIKNNVTNSNNRNKAINNVNHFFDTVDKSCIFKNDDQGISEYVSCANKVLHDNFYYTPSVEVSNNFAIHRSDCDLNTYLLMDALKMKGVDGYITYAPGHAFLAWKNRFGNYNYRETTFSNNRGSEANLSLPFYRKTFEKSYYTPMDSQLAEVIYTALIYDKSNGHVNIEELYKQNSQNAFINDWYFYSKDKNHTTTRSDAQLMVSLLHTDLTSTDKKIAIVNYLRLHDQHDKAVSMLGNIPPTQCGLDCFIAGKELGLKWYITFNWFFVKYDNYYTKFSVPANVQQFKQSILYLAGALLIFVTSFFGLTLWYKKLKLQPSS